MPRRVRLTALLLVTSLAVIVSAGAARADDLQGPAGLQGLYHHVGTAECMAIAGGNTNDGAPIVQFGCNGTMWNEYFYVRNRGTINGTTVYAIQSAVASGKCLSVDGWSTEPGAAILDWSCGINASEANAAQEWTAIWSTSSSGRSAYAFLNIATGQYLSVSGGGSADNTPLVQWPYNGQDNQLWTSTV
jgi:hypothetical protein